MINRGSEWRRWDLHIHTKGTNKNDCYACADMETYCELLFKKALTKEIAAIGITDYFSIERYLEVKAYQQHIEEKAQFTADEKARVKEIFLLPNVELRMLPVTDSSKLINIHCIFNPAYDRKLDNDFFASLSFKYNDKDYKMNCSGLIELGKAVNDKLDDKAAYKKGVELFTLAPNQLKELFDGNAELRENTLIVVSNSNRDGNSGLQHHYDLFENESGSLDGVRRSIYQLSDCIFSGNAKDFTYFLGKGRDSAEVICSQIRSLKPCVHGSDAHTEDKMFEPDEKKYCWIKANLDFNGLKQILYEPEERVRIQTIKPDEKNLYQVIDSITLNEEGFWRGAIFLNPNLNTIIGGRSTGKSSLLKAIAVKHGSNKIDPDDFIYGHLDGVTIRWQDGNDQLGRHIEYFPQSYMHDIAKRSEKTNEIIEGIIRQTDEQKLLSGYDQTISSATKFVTDGTFKLFQIQKEINALRQTITEKGKKEGVEQQLQLLNARKMELQKASALTSEEQRLYEALSLQLKDKQGQITKATEDVGILTKIQAASPFLPDFEERSQFAFLTFGQNLTELTNSYQTIKARTEEELRSVIQKKIEQTQAASKQLQSEIASIQAMPLYVKGQQVFQGNKEMADLAVRIEEEEKRHAEIVKLEATLAQQVKQRNELFMQIILSHVSVKQAAAKATKQLQINLDGLEIQVKLTYKRKELKEFLEARLNLRSSARQDYIKDLSDNYGNDTELHTKDFLEKLLQNKVDLKNYNDPQSVATEFLSKNWFQLNFTLSYQGDAFADMSEGKQAFVILKLLLEFSDTKCPILIDQPEDSLDNRAIYRELVSYIKEKKKHRQIILVTHNSNVVVSADAENVIIANQDGTDSHNADGNKFQYVNGALEESKKRDKAESVILYSQGIREHVCDILEGGKDAFEKREKKYGFRMR